MVEVLGGKVRKCVRAVKKEESKYVLSTGSKIKRARSSIG